MLFSNGGYTQGFNTFLTAMNGGVLNPFGTNKYMEIDKTISDLVNSLNGNYFIDEIEKTGKIMDLFNNPVGCLTSPAVFQAKALQNRIF
jgi:hypothetical protein